MIHSLRALPRDGFFLKFHRPWTKRLAHGYLGGDSVGYIPFK
jgi:hypothetical protein